MVFGNVGPAEGFCLEALDLRRALHAESAGSFGSVKMAHGLVDASVLLGSLGHAETALELTEEAVA